MKKFVAVRSGEIAPVTGYYCLSGPMKKKILLRRGQTAPIIESVVHVWFLTKQVIRNNMKK